MVRISDNNAETIIKLLNKLNGLQGNNISGLETKRRITISINKLKQQKRDGKENRISSYLKNKA